MIIGQTGYPSIDKPWLKPSGKRDIESLGNEVEGFLYSDKAFLLGK